MEIVERTENREMWSRPQGRECAEWQVQVPIVRLFSVTHVDTPVPEREGLVPEGTSRKFCDDLVYNLLAHSCPLPKHSNVRNPQANYTLKST